MSEPIIVHVETTIQSMILIKDYADIAAAKMMAMDHIYEMLADALKDHPPMYVTFGKQVVTKIDP